MNLLERYRPRCIGALLGLAWVNLQMEKFLEQPYSTAFLLEGASGTGKTSAAFLLAEALGIDTSESDGLNGLWQIASGEQTGESVRKAIDGLRFRPLFSAAGWRVLIVNECDNMSPGAAMVWLDSLENLPPQTVVVFSTNNAHKLPGR